MAGVKCIDCARCTQELVYICTDEDGDKDILSEDEVQELSPCPIFQPKGPQKVSCTECKWGHESMDFVPGPGRTATLLYCGSSDKPEWANIYRRSNFKHICEHFEAKG